MGSLLFRIVIGFLKYRFSLSCRLSCDISPDERDRLGNAVQRLIGSECRHHNMVKCWFHVRVRRLSQSKEETDRQTYIQTDKQADDEGMDVQTKMTASKFNKWSW